MNIRQITPPYQWGVKALVAFILTFVLASCSKDESINTGERVIRIEANSTRTYYAISKTEGITYTSTTSTGIACLINQDTKHPKWILSYEEIAKRLDISLSHASTMQIAFTKVLKDGLWRFAVQFDGQKEGSEYSIDVNPETGSIEWVQSIEEMPDGEITLKFEH